MSDIKDMVRLLGTRFVARRDVKAFQRDDGAWFPDRSTFTMQDFRDHLAGTKTLGHYLLDTDGNCKYFAFDIDLVKHNRDCNPGPGERCTGCPMGFANLEISADGNPVAVGEPHVVIPRQAFLSDDERVVNTLRIHLRLMAEGLAYRIHKRLDIPVAIATSGHKGLHVYGFTGLMPAEACKLVAFSILEEFTCFEQFRGENFWRHTSEYSVLDIEVFPKQTNLDGKELGNLMKLPLGLHRVTKQRAEFLTTKSPPDRWVTMDPEYALSGDLPWE